MSRNAGPETVHYEVYTSQMNDGLIRVVCTCPIPEDHSYDEWVDLGRPLYNSRGVVKVGVHGNYPVS